MAISAVVVRPFYRGFITGGLTGASNEIRVVLTNVVGGTPFASQSAVEYAIWPAGLLGALGAPTLKSSVGTTNASGELVVDTTGTFATGDEVIVMIRKAQGATGGADDTWGVGSDTVSWT